MEYLGRAKMDTHTASKGRILRGCLTWPDLAGTSKESCLARGTNLALSGGQGKTRLHKSQDAHKASKQARLLSIFAW
jgi:hypothetical protein